MDLGKFVSLLVTKSLFFCRSDRFEDPYEGSQILQSLEYRRHRLEGYLEAIGTPEEKKDPEMLMRLMRIKERYMRQYNYISCWHMSEYESAAMWKLYAQTNEAIAIQTTYQKLSDNLPERCIMGMVRYIDYNSPDPIDTTEFSPYFYKRLSFSHEKEIRAIIQDHPTDPELSSLLIANLYGQGVKEKILMIEEHLNGERTNKTMSNPLPGKNIAVDLHQLIEDVRIAPTAPKWFLEAVQDATEKYKLEIAPQQSELDAPALH